MQDLAANFPESNSHSTDLATETSHLTTDSNGTASDRERDDAVQPSHRSLYSEFTLSHPDIVLSDVSRNAPAVTIRPERRVADSESGLLVFSVDGEDLTGFDELLDVSASVEDPLPLQRTEHSRSYRVAIADQSFTVTDPLIRAEARVLDVVGSGGTWELRAQFRSRAAFTTFRAYCVTEEIEFKLHRLYWNISTQKGQGTGLTPEQREALILAYTSGYYDVPRDISQKELADNFGISPSAVSQRLRRATGQLIEGALRSDIP